jgi:threonine aldolase
MKGVNRRRFLQGGTAAAAALGWTTPLGGAQAGARRGASPDDPVVRLSGDGLGLTSRQYSRLLAQIAEERNIQVDNYSVGGVIDELEQEFARLLGKERAVFMPTGTLANNLAVRALAGGPSRVIVQEESHLYQDEGDGAQTLSNLTLIPLAAGRATFTADEVQDVLERMRTGRVATPVTVISIETPVRRRQGEYFDPAELQKIVALAMREGIRLHLDGARVFLQAAYTGEDVAETARPFDTVYVSLYKYFNAASGAILAGPRDLLDGMFHTRRMFGGGLWQAWPLAAVARHYLSGFGERYARAVRTAHELTTALGQHGAFTVESIVRGTNLFRLKVRTTDAVSFQKRLATRGVILAAPQADTFVVAVNETITRLPAAEIADRFASAVAG